MLVTLERTIPVEARPRRNARRSGRTASRASRCRRDPARPARDSDRLEVGILKVEPAAQHVV